MLMACLLIASSCSSSSTPTGKNEAVLLLPPDNAGWAGWCASTSSKLIIGCGAYVRSRPPIIAESWSAEGEKSNAVIRGFALTTDRVTSVAIKGKGSISTRTESTLPPGLRSVVVEIHGEGPAAGESFPRFTPLNSKGVAIPESAQPGKPLVTWTKTIGLDPAHPSIGVCRIEAEPLTGLTIEWGSVIAQAGSYHGDFLGQAFQACATTACNLDGWPIVATVLLSASNPRSPSGPLPGALSAQGTPRCFLWAGHWRRNRCTAG
jgi:hypothetical protein